MLTNVYQTDRLWDWRAALLAIAIVEISSTRLVATEWAPFLYFTQTMGFIGVILGLALGYSNFSRQTVIRLAVGYTFVLIPAQLLSAVERTDWLWRDILALFDRLFISLDQFIRNKPVDDPFIFRFNCYADLLAHRSFCRVLANPSQGFFECGSTLRAGNPDRTSL